MMLQEESAPRWKGPASVESYGGGLEERERQVGTLMLHTIGRYGT